MFSKIIAAIDSSPAQMRVFDEAVSIAKIHNANLMLLHVLSSDEEGSPARPEVSAVEQYSELVFETIASYQQQMRKYEDRWLEELRSLTNTATKAGVMTEFTQTHGRAERVICDLAHTWGADLVVMGRKYHSEIGELLFSSASNYVFHRANCSLLLVHR